MEEILSQKDRTIPGGFSFNHHDWTCNRNYAIMEIGYKNGFARIDTYMLTSDIDIKPKVEVKISNTKYLLDPSFSRDGCDCCIFI